MPAVKEIREAKDMLAKAGIVKSVTPTQLVAAAKQLRKPLRDALQALAEMFAEAEGAQ